MNNLSHASFSNPLFYTLRHVKSYFGEHGPSKCSFWMCYLMQHMLHIWCSQREISLCSPSNDYHGWLWQRQEEKTHPRHHHQVFFVFDIFSCIVPMYLICFWFECLCLCKKKVLCPVSVEPSNQRMPAELGPTHPVDAAPEGGGSRCAGDGKENLESR